MKGFNVKKLAAIATGAALLGTAIAPIVSATNVAKEDIYNSDGSPKVNIVVGSQAAVSDAIWAGNLAAKIAEKAATTKTVSVSATGAGGDVGAGLDLSDLTIDVTVGGTITFGAGSKKYNVNLNSGTGSGDAEVLTAMDGGSDTNALTDAQLTHLYNKTLVHKVNEGDQSNQSTSLTNKELIGLDIDAKFDTGSSVRDLVAKISSGDFSYKTTIGSSTTGVDLGTTSFVDDNDDNVKIIFFGEEYELNTATLTGSKNLKLVKTSAKESYNEGETVEGLVGDNAYEDEEVSVKVVQIVQSGAASTSYSATFELYDSEGNLIDTQTVSSGTNLRTTFKDDSSNEALASNLFIDTIAVGSTTGVGYVEVTKGTDTIEIFDSKIYPYDSTATSGTKAYTAYITAGTSDANSLYSIEVRNSAEQWASVGGDSFDFGPLYPTSSAQSLTGKTGATAEFLQSLPDGTQGKGYANVEFVGFEDKEEKTPINIGKNNTIVHNLGVSINSSSNGGISFRADNDALRSIPFYVKLTDSNSGSTFNFEGKDVWYSMRFGTTGKDTANDYNLTINTGDYVNGRIWTITDPSTAEDVNVNLSIGGIGPVGPGGPGAAVTRGQATFAAATDVNLHTGDSLTVDGVTYKITDNNITGGTQMGIAVDQVVEYRLNNDTGTQLYNTSGDTTDATYGLMALTQDITFDGNQVTSGSGGVPVTFGLYTQESARPVYYAAKYNSATDKFYLLLDADKFGSGQSDKIQNNHEVWFTGTTLPADDGTYTEGAFSFDTLAGSGLGDANSQIQRFVTSAGTVVWAYGHYVPKESDFNNSSQNGGLFSSSNAFAVAHFNVNDAVSNGDFNVYIDTVTGGNIGPFGGTTNLASYANDVAYRGNPSFNLTSGTQSDYLKAGYTDAATKAWLLDDDAGAKFSAPQAAEKINIVVSGVEMTRDVEGGETLTLKVGETGTTSAGSKISLTNPTGGSCNLTGDAGSAVCSANPATYQDHANINSPLVYLDTDAPTGTNIIVGGHLVNRLAQGLADRLTAPGNKVAEVDTESGDIVLAGYTAEDTGSAVQELIDDIDSWTA
ncbi:MAG TPA: S-layer protein [archaeon]|nr:S-layer protein [archaeon]